MNSTDCIMKSGGPTPWRGLAIGQPGKGCTTVSTAAAAAFSELDRQRVLGPWGPFVPFQDRAQLEQIMGSPVPFQDGDQHTGNTSSPGPQGT